ncbi:TetR/AcrR family transcriptional regulator [Microbispora sp. H11081]|uniref:TetR/AcrR family transcriptional regulator n=1 Tax=Microbispora sp. H11081 TaxID=2729107 RepID=UPI0014766A71|nr:helix-turn-helix domain-containing protein [Microbispora sp. H11081]
MGERRERADAGRNRRAILWAAEELIAEHGLDHVSLDRVAAAAGVGKGTVFRRFGSRTGLVTALPEERAVSIGEAIGTGPPPVRGLTEVVLHAPAPERASTEAALV